MKIAVGRVQFVFRSCTLMKAYSLRVAVRLYVLSILNRNNLFWTHSPSHILCVCSLLTSPSYVQSTF